MLEDCNKYVRESKIGIVWLSSIALLIVLYAVGITESLNNELVSVYIVFATWFGLKEKRGQATFLLNDDSYSYIRLDK